MKVALLTSKLILGKIHLLSMKSLEKGTDVKIFLVFRFNFRFYSVSGLETLLGLVCFGLFLYQSIALIRNFSSRDTLRTIKEVDHEGPMPSPLVIICQDPANLNISEDNIRATAKSRTNFTVDKIATAFKVIY